MKKIYFGLFILLVFHFPIQGQDTLTLTQAIAIGLRNNFDVQIEKLNVEQSKRNNTWGQAGMLPTISFDLNQYNSIIQQTPATPFAVPGDNIANGVTGQLNAQFILFNGFAVHVNKKRLNQLEQLSEGNANMVIENTIKGIILAYYRSLVEKKRLRILQKNMRLSKERYDYVKLKKELGTAITFDVVQEQVNYLTDSANVINQNIIYKKSIRQLTLLLNEEAQPLPLLSDTLAYQQEVYNFETLRAKMISSNTNLRNQYINQEILKHTTKIEKANRMPKVTLNLGANGSFDLLNAEFSTLTGNQVEDVVGNVNRNPNTPVYQTRDEIALLRQTQTGHSYGGYGNIGVNFTLFNGHKIKRAIENAEVKEKIADLQINKLKKSLHNDLVTSYDLYKLRNQLVSIASTKLQAAQLSLALANMRYKNGVLSALELRVIQENTRNVALERYEVIFNSIAARVELIRLTGGLLDNFIQ